MFSSSLIHNTPFCLIFVAVFYKVFDWPHVFFREINFTKISRVKLISSANMKIDIPVISQVYDSKLVKQICPLPQILCVISTSTIIFFILLVTPMTVFSILNYIGIKNLVLHHHSNYTKPMLIDIEMTANESTVMNGCNFRKDCGKYII